MTSSTPACRRAIRSETREKLRTVHAGDDSVVENPIVTRGGDERLIEWRTAYLRDGAGRITGTLSSGSDITDRKRAQAAVREERDRAQRYLDTAEVILLALDVDGRITLINRKGCDVLGRSEAELLGRNWVDTCIPERQRASPRREVRESHRRRRVPRREPDPRQGRPGADGRMAKSPAPRRRRPRRGHVELGRRHHRAPRRDRGPARRGRAHALRAPARQRRDLGPGLHDGRAALVGDARSALRTAARHVRRHVRRLHGAGPPRAIARRVRETIEKATKSGAEFSVRNRALAARRHGSLADGRRPRPARRTTANPCAGSEFRWTSRLTGRSRSNITRRKRWRRSGRLAGGVAHDFNNLLTVILGSLRPAPRRARRGRPGPPEASSRSRRRARPPLSLVRQLLAFSRKQIIEPTLIDLNEVVENMRGMLGRLIGEDVRVVVTLSPNLAKVKADQGQIEQIVMNLAVNARDAMPRGGTLTIETAEVELDEDYAKIHLGVKPGSYVALTITDTGTGMTPEVQARLFEPFFTTKDGRQGHGARPGDRPRHRRCGAAGPSASTARSGRGPRSRSIFRPATPRDVAAPAAPQPHRTAAGGETVLVVEDAEGLRKLARRILEGLGYRVLIAANADEARRRVRASQRHRRAPHRRRHARQERSRPARRAHRAETRADGHLHVRLHRGGHQPSRRPQPGIQFLQKPFTAETLGRKIRDALGTYRLAVIDRLGEERRGDPDLRSAGGCLGRRGA